MSVRNNLPKRRDRRGGHLPAPVTLVAVLGGLGALLGGVAALIEATT